MTEVTLLQQFKEAVPSALMWGGVAFVIIGAPMAIKAIFFRNKKKMTEPRDSQQKSSSALLREVRAKIYISNELPKDTAAHRSNRENSCGRKTASPEIKAAHNS